jgi:hypothetical protein
MQETTSTDMQAATPPLFVPHAVSIGAITSRLEALSRPQVNAVHAQLEQIRPAHRALTFFRLLPGWTLYLANGQAHLTTSDAPIAAPGSGDPWVVLQTSGMGERQGPSVRYPLANGSEAGVPLDTALGTFGFFRDLPFSADWVAIADPRTYEALELVYSIADFEWDGNVDDLHPAPCRLHSTVNITLEPGCVVLESTTGDSFFRGFSGLTAVQSLSNVDGEVQVRESQVATGDNTTAQAAVLTRERIRIWC